MEHDTQTPTYQTSDPTSFAYTSARSRWPSILTSAIDDVHRTISSLPASHSNDIKEGKIIVENIATLKYELQHNRKLTPLPDDGRPDIADYNSELEARGTPNWHDVQWLYSECYLYRRLYTLFSLSPAPFWKSYDVFNRQKMSTFKSSRPAVLELAAKYRDIISQLSSGKDAVDSSDGQKIEDAEKLLFTEMAEICLWGNATDLSLLTNLTYEDIQKLQGSKARKESEKNILVNDLSKAFEVLRAAQKEKKEMRRLDIVLDNAGFELFVDLILAGYLIATGLATEVVLHPKSVPWFVSDVVPKDLGDLLAAMADPQGFYTAAEDKDGKTPEPLSDEEVENVKFLFEDWSQLHSEGQLKLRPNMFWTAAGSFWRMPTEALDLMDDLSESELVIFKGDLNYRKLTGDVSCFVFSTPTNSALTLLKAAWDATTPFATAIGPLGGRSGIRTLALRTCKGDVVVGLPKGKDEEIRATEGGGGHSGARKWAWNGKWAVVQFCDGKA
jgi:damage-control phosphatase, subfamily III